MNEKETKVIYPELSYKIVGCLFEVYNVVGSGHKEKFYQSALAEEFVSRKIKYEEQVPVSLFYKDKKVGVNYLDFLIEDKIVLELKIGRYFSKRNLIQTLDYLKQTKMKLGIIANFSRDGLKFYRVLNLK